MFNKRLLALCLTAAGFSATASAGTFDATTSGQPGETVALQVTFAGDGATTNADLILDYDNTHIDITVDAANVDGPTGNEICQRVSATRIRIVSPDGGATPLPNAATLTCEFQVEIDAGAPFGLIPFTVNLIDCADRDGNNTVCTLSATSGVDVVDGPQPPTLVPPASGTITFAGGTVGTQPTSNIQFSITGGDPGESVDLTCDTPSAGFTIVSGAPQTITTGGTVEPIVVRAPALAATAQIGMVTCGGSTFSLEAPAGTPVVGPTLTPPATTSVTTTPALVGQTGRVNILFSAAGGDAGQSSTLTCSVLTGAPTVSIISGGNQTITTGTQPEPVVIGVTMSASAQPNVGTVDCNGTVFTISAPAGTVFVEPEFIPASSLWSQLALIALFASLGGLMLAFRRNG